MSSFTHIGTLNIPSLGQKCLVKLLDGLALYYPSIGFSFLFTDRDPSREYIFIYVVGQIEFQAKVSLILD